MQEKASVPAIRFAGFTDDWEQRKLGEVCAVSSGVMGDSLLTEGQYHLTRIETIADGVVDEKRVGYSNQKPDESYLLNAGDILYSNINSISHMGKVAKYQGNSVLYHGINLLRLRPSVDVDSEFLLYLLNTESRRNWAKAHANQAVSQASINQSLLESQEIMTCKKDEQIQIGAFFRHLDQLITLHQRKYTCLSNIKKSMLEKMFPKNGVVVPEIRFVGFTDDWEQSMLGEMMNVTSVKRIHQSDWTDNGVRFLRARDIVSAAKNEESDDCLYISKEKYDEYSLLSGKVAIGDLLVTGVGTIGVPYLVRDSEPLYFKDGNIIWFQNGSKIDGNFFLYSFFGKTIQGFVNESAGIGTVGTYTIESGKKTPIFLPEMKEQQKIGAFFCYLDHLITLHQRELERLQNIKKSCLEKMFV